MSTKLKFKEADLTKLKREMDTKKEELTEAKTIMKEVERNIEGLNEELAAKGVDNVDSVETYIEGKIEDANSVYDEILEEVEKVRE